MDLKNALKLNMEICYVPVAKLKDVQEMMANWNDNNKFIRYCSIASIAISFINLHYLNVSDSDFAMLMCIFSDIIMAALAILVNKSNKLIYYFAFIGTMLFSFSSSFIRLEALTLPIAIALSLPFLITCFFSYKAILNYEDVYLKLKARKGFPHFVFSTADMYADKIYLRDKKEVTVAEKRVEASYNSFNEKSEIIDEETKRMNTLRYEELKRHQTDVSSDEYFEAKEVKHYYDGNKKYKYRLSFLGIDLLIPHDDIETSSKEEKRRIMSLWNDMKDNLFKNEALFLMFLLLLVLAVEIGGLGFAAAIYFLAIVVYVFGTNFIKLDNRLGFFLTTGSVYSFLFALSVPSVRNMVTVGIMFVVISYYNIFILPKLIKWLINMPLYKKMSKEPGFPSFFDDKKELYGDDYYIVEETKPIIKRTNQEKIVINIGYDDEDEEVNKRLADFNYKEKNETVQKLDNTAWNAFNYLENDTDNSAYDEFAIYEEVNRKRREAELKEEFVKPNKEMGRKKKDED